MTIKPIAILVAALLAGSLTGCGDKKAETQGQAGGEILPRSISDEMLPMDTATSKPPLAPKSASSPDDVDPGDTPRKTPERKADAPAPAEQAPDADEGE